MKRVFVDTSAFLRFFTEDEREQHDKAAQLFRRAAAAKVALVTASSREAGAGEIATFNRKHFERLGAALYGF